MEEQSWKVAHRCQLRAAAGTHETVHCPTAVAPQAKVRQLVYVIAVFTVGVLRWNLVERREVEQVACVVD